MSKKSFLIISLVFSVFVSAQVVSANAITYDDYMANKQFENSLNAALTSGLQDQGSVSGGGMAVENDSIISPEPYPSYIYVSTSNITQVVPDEVYVDGSYYISAYASQSEAKAELQSKYDAVKAALADYGTINLNSMNTYAQSYYPYPMGESTTDQSTTQTQQLQYSGDLSFRVTLDNMKHLNDVSDIISENGMTSWKSAYVSEDKILDIELSMVDSIKSMIVKKTSLYEKLLGKDLTTINSLDISAWTGSTFNMEKGTVDLTINANVSYSVPQ